MGLVKVRINNFNKNKKNKKKRAKEQSDQQRRLAAHKKTLDAKK
jgi:hypothetical protein